MESAQALTQVLTQSAAHCMDTHDRDDVTPTEGCDLQVAGKAAEGLDQCDDGEECRHTDTCSILQNKAQIGTEILKYLGGPAETWMRVLIFRGFLPGTEGSSSYSRRY